MSWVNKGVTAAAVLAAICLVSGVAVVQAAEKAAQVKRLSDGHPDLNGTWDNGSGIDFIKPQTGPNGSICVSGCAKPAAAAPAGPAPARKPPDFPVYKPEFLVKVEDMKKRQIELDPVLRCKSPGLPRIGPPDKIVQTPGQVVFLYDDVSGGFFRIIHTDGRPRRSDVDESFFGDSLGHWEGDTLVIEAIKFNDESWLTDNGAFHSTALKVTERLKRDGDTIEYQATAEDPKVLAEPWHIRPRMMKLTDVEMVESVPCVDQDLKHVVDGSHHDNPR